QGAGYGRRGRAWASAEGDLACTYLAPAPDRPGELAFVAALAVAEAIEPWTGDMDIKLKWPNDILADGAKLVGILLELHTGA
ncbi:biotin--[acetyl-CoA-carboxylase] ligase, partial [bacterium LRH843]|nr:biotin--[acetyl-CoA-carboxylase] ligase [bacterium LRH843]